MKSLAFIDHPYHRLTKSGQVFDFLSEHFYVEKFYDNRYGNGNIDLDKIRKFDVNFYFQTSPLFPHKNVVWCPMYDDTYRSDLPGVKYVCLCKRVYENIVNERRILAKYWKKPESFKNSEKKVIFFWNRKPEIAWENIRTFFSNYNIDKVYFKNSPDPGYPKASISRNDIEKFNIQFVDFEDENVYRERLMDTTILICPRKLEGIGLFMLDGFSRGHLIFGYDNPAMNEYIVNWKNGILFNESHYNALNLDNIQQIRRESYSSCKIGYSEWIKSVQKILDFIDR